ncbi:hypothetical protein LTR56_017944 [Elasticomyces elasticus]|nr:hypothetical protein LTR56_017944 [Elasticomyces elasticus]KAK3647205.1 hypothetical protein LTR22_013866 [Elasticomyces elasticus]KAK4913821.1 hypothetical protein LTR49_017857 [Elasticomyces elasticus]KAK5752904.1 hypothetical protein LTS12_016976 [Elasticomyces elasticus]
MALSPFALNILGLDSASRRRREGEADTTSPDTLHMAPTRSSRRATSHYNFFQTICSSSQDSPPAYATALNHKVPSVRRKGEHHDALPGYTCTVSAEAKLLLQLESVNPLHGIAESDWREVYVVVRGTLLCIHRVKDGGAGKLLRSYTLQHAEVGLAVDSQHQTLIPQTRMARLIPSSARNKAWQKDPDLFKSVQQTILRIRIETDQILLADASEDRIHELIHAISAGIDISCSIDERSIPRQCTVPRRRRRQRPTSDNLNDPNLLAEQERILREMYPAFADQTPALRSTQRRNVIEEPANDLVPSPSREEDDLDFAIMREDFAAPNNAAPTQSTTSRTRPTMTRHTTTSSVISSLSTDMIYATSPNNFSASGKWQPPHPRTAAQIQRYVRRCMPVLMADSVRASDVLICHGKRVKINWRMEMLEEWVLNPPSYKSHGFKKSVNTQIEALGAELQRTRSQNSQTPSATNSSPLSSQSLLEDGVDRIETIDTSLASLELGKVQTSTEKDLPLIQLVKKSPQLEAKMVEASHPGTHIHGVVFCF